MRFSYFKGIFFSTLIGVSTFGFANDHLPIAKKVHQQSGIVDLGLTGKQLGQTQSTYLIPIQIDKAPIEATIDMSFVVITTGVCPASYFPTEVFLNNESIADIDFRNFDEGSTKNLSIALPPQYQRQGENQIKIITGDCNEGLDSLRFNSVALSINKIPR